MNTEIVRTLALTAGSLCALTAAAVQSYSSRVEQKNRIEVINPDPASSQSFDRMEAKNRVVRELLMGQITFWQAASRFRQINRTPEGAPPASLPTHGPRPRAIPADGEDERNCMQVLLNIDASFDLDPDVRRAAIERFEAMFLNEASAGIPLSAAAR